MLTPDALASPRKSCLRASLYDIAGKEKQANVGTGSIIGGHSGVNVDAGVHGKNTLYYPLSIVNVHVLEV